MRYFFELQEQGAAEPVALKRRRRHQPHTAQTKAKTRETAMARDTADFVQQSSERAMQAANFGTTWGREFAEQSFNQSRQAVDAFLQVSRKMAEDFETQAAAIREHMTALTQKTMANTMEYGQKLASVKEPQEFAQCQSEFMARQAQTIADQTKEFGQKMQKAAQVFTSNASNAMAEASRRTEEAVSTMTSRADQASKRQRAEV
ncbi:MAG TPA: phasin family protein [Pseudolabrys sp.]|nr:phasin family protein [Pseudolabrys sp.]